jgi:uncharacterized protein YktA (UPF0223 family)
MEFKECYVSKNGISCITNINTLHNFKKIVQDKITEKNILKKFPNFMTKNNLIFYLSLRSCEYIYNILIKDNLINYFNNCYKDCHIKNLNENDLLAIMFS